MTVTSLVRATAIGVAVLAQPVIIAHPDGHIINQLNYAPEPVQQLIPTTPVHIHKRMERAAQKHTHVMNIAAAAVMKADA